MTSDKGEQSKIIFDKSELNLGGWGFDELLGSGPAQQNLGPKAKILYGVFLYVNIN